MMTKVSKQGVLALLLSIGLTTLLAGCPGETVLPDQDTGSEQVTPAAGSGDAADSSATDARDPNIGVDTTNDPNAANGQAEDPDVGDGDTQEPPSVSLEALYGDYTATFTGSVGGPYEPADSLVSGTTTGVVPFTLTGTVTLSASEPGVISVPDGESVPGVAPGDVIYGAALIQNPIHVFIGTPGASAAGDFGIYSTMRFGLPSDPSQLFYTGCSGAGGPFDCVPMFYRRTTPSGDSVNLVYFTDRVRGDGQTTTISGVLADTHTAEAAAANLFSVPVESPIMGSLLDSFMLEPGASFEITIADGHISGWLRGSGYSVAGLALQTAILEVTFEGTKD